MSGLAPLNALRAFEATARRGGFKAAAQELNVTAAAVGQQVRQLEAMIGAPLFERDGRKLVLSERGAAALAPLKRGFELMGEASAALRAAEASLSVSIASAVDVMAMWLSQDFKDWAGPVTFVQSGEAADLALVLSEDTSVPNRAARLMDEVLTPLATPGLIERMEGQGLDSLQSVPLIEDASLEEDWRAWIASRGGYGVEITPRFRVSNALVALELAKAGAGIVLARKPLAFDLIRQGVLLPVLSDGDWIRPRAYYLISPPTPSLGTERLAARIVGAAAVRQDLAGEL